MSERPDQGRYSGEEGFDLNERAVTEAVRELVIAAGRPEGWEILSHYEMTAWKHAVRRVVRAYQQA